MRLLYWSRFASFVCVAALLSLATILIDADRATAANRYIKTREEIIKLQRVQIDKADVLLVGDSHVDSLVLSTVFESVVVFNAGVGGCRISDTVRMVKDCLNSFHAKVAFVHVGINDCGIGKEKSLTAFKSDLIELIHELKKSSNCVIVSTIIPVNKNLPLGSNMFNIKHIYSANRIIREVACDEKICLFDSWKIFIDLKGEMSFRYTNDGVHLTSRGYALWKNDLVQLLREKLNEN